MTSLANDGTIAIFRMSILTIDCEDMASSSASALRTSVDSSRWPCLATAKMYERMYEPAPPPMPGNAYVE